MIELKIDPELRDLLTPLSDEEFEKLKDNILKKGYDVNFPIITWNGYVVDGHNRYRICKENNITDFPVGTLAYKTKDDVKEWMLDTQLGRRNLSPIQRIAIAEKYRSIYEKKARENRSANGGDKKSELQNSASAVSPQDKVDVRDKLAKVANVSHDTYSKGAKILNSGNEEVKNAVISGELSINAGYNKIKKKKSTNKSEASKNSSSNETQNKNIEQEQVKSTQVSSEVKQICNDLKTEKTKEYLDSVWDYKVSIIECMNADFEMYYDGFISILSDMSGRVTKDELDECIANAEKLVDKMVYAIEFAKETELKQEG